MYPRRPGSSDFGREYEIKMTALLALRCATLPDTEEMWVASNMDDVGDFDDIVLCRRTSTGNCTAYLIQLKHQDNPSQLTEKDFTYSTKDKGKKRKKDKEKFSLSKYADGFAKMKERIDNIAEKEPEIITNLRNIDMVMILFTNKDTEKCEFLECISDNSMKFLNTAEVKNNIYKFDHRKLNYDPSFLEHLILFSNQIHVSEVEKLIAKEIKVLVQSSNLDYKEIVEKFVTFVRMWEKGSSETNNKQTNAKVGYVLTKFDIISKLTDILLEPLKINFSKDLFSDYDCPQKHIWNEIVSNQSITVVEFSEATLQHMKDFIGTEVGKYCQETSKTWSDHLPKRAVQFYEAHEDLNTQMLKIISKHKKLTKYEIYENLFFNNKLSLLLCIKDVQNYNALMKILKISNFNLKVVIIVDATEELVFSKTKHALKYFVSMDDLANCEADKILSQPVKIQGRSSILLRSLVDTTMYKWIKCKDIIQILSNNFTVGYSYDPVREYYIKRSLSKIVLNPEILRRVNDEIFVVQENGDLKNLSLGSQMSNIITVQKHEPKLAKTLKHKAKAVHELVFHENDFLEWKRSYGSTTNIKQDQRFKDVYMRWHGKDGNLDYLPNLDYLWVDVEDMLTNNDEINFCLISASPGMGKSSLLNYVALQVPTDMWVLKINLNEHEEYYEDAENLDNYLDYFNGRILKSHDCTNLILAKAVFQKLAHEKKIVAFLDGFDEISIEYREEATRIVKKFHEDGFVVWLTTRSVMKSQLEEEFNTVAKTLKPFTIAEQKKLLTKYYTHINKSVTLDVQNRQAIIEQFVEKLLVAVEENLSDTSGEFAGNPLQAKLLANAFRKECEACLTTGTVKFNSKFDLLYLYNEFIKRKIDTLVSKFGKDAKRTRIFLEKTQKLFAMKTMFGRSKFLKKIDIDGQLKEYYSDEQYKLQFLQREGIVIVEQTGNGNIQKFNVNFVHRSFAEYLAAVWLSENINSKEKAVEEVVRKILVLDRFTYFYQYRFLFKILDNILAKDCPLHLALINGQSKKENLSEINVDNVTLVDKCGRSVLHITALYGVHHPDDYRDFTKVKDKMVDFIEQLPCDQIANVGQDNLGLTPLDYGLASWSLAVANKISEMLNNLSLNINLSKCGLYETCTDYYIQYCLDLQYNSLFKTLLVYFAYSGLLDGRVDKESTIATYAKRLAKEGMSPEVHFSVTTISELFQFKNIKQDSSHQDYYYDLCLAAALGTEENITYLLNQDADVNKQDVYSNTALHYAVRHNRKDIVKLLLNNGAKVDIFGEYGETALYVAAEYGLHDILKEFLLRGADINAQNDNGFTPLYTAFKYSRANTTQMLLDNGADVNTEDESGITILHFASQRGNCDVVRNLLNRGVHVEKQNHEGDTALHLALQFRKLQVAKLLLANTGNVNLQNYRYGCTYLYFAALCGDCSIVSELLSKGAEVNKPISNGDTPLHAAVSSGNVDVVKLLLVHGADHTLVGCRGRTVLHEAAYQGCIEVISELLFEDVINKQDRYGNTPLDIAQQNKHTDAAKLLLAHGATNTKQ